MRKRTCSKQPLGAPPGRETRQQNETQHAHLSPRGGVESARAVADCSPPVVAWGPPSRRPAEGRKKARMQHSPPELCPMGVMRTIPAVHVKRNQASSSPSSSDLVDAAFGTQFSIVRASEVSTPDAWRSVNLSNSITGIRHFGRIRSP